jgi:hypothetical protein
MLNPAHRGYDYQDLLVAFRLVDVLLGTTTVVTVDAKLFPGDLFDDLTTVDLDGKRIRAQFKHREDADDPLSTSSFTAVRRGLRLDQLVASAVADRDTFGPSADATVFRCILRDARPEDALARVLTAATPDPGPFVPGMQSVRLRFAPDSLWPSDSGSGSTTDVDNPFHFLRDGRLLREDVVWFCERAVIEVEAPRASFDLLHPGPAELLLLERVRKDVGAEAYPNNHRSAVDVAQSLVIASKAYRQHSGTPSRHDLVRRTQLRQDFGAVARAHPVDHSAEIPRPATIKDILAAAVAAADAARPLLLVGPPGQGKSWACDQFVAELTLRGWLVAEHYCFLGDSDFERTQRVQGDAVLGTLLKRIADQAPETVTEHRPRFAADEHALEHALRRARDNAPDRRIALVVDGLDHVTRVRGATIGRADPARLVADELASLSLPSGCALMVLSQPGPHLQPLEDLGAHRVSLPGFSTTELLLLGQRTGALLSTPSPHDPDDAADSPAARADEQARSHFVATLEECSRGNALYATYLCREVVRHPLGRADPAAVLVALPPFDGTLYSYYSYLVSTLPDGAMWVAEILGLLQFALTRAELREVRPDYAHRLDAALSHLAPVLLERAAQGGIRIYHESFARFVRARAETTPEVATTILEGVARWLQRRGFFDDARAFRFLIPTLASAGRDGEVLALVQPDFVSRAVAAGFTASAIQPNLATATEAATRLRDWPALTRFVELARAAASFEFDQLDTKIVAFADVVIGLLGVERIANALLFDGATTVPARAGLQLCAGIDAAGGVAPWKEYLEAFARESEGDNTSYGQHSDQQVALAWLRGRLRTAYQRSGPLVSDLHASPVEGEERATSFGQRPVSLERVAGWVQESHLPACPVINAVLDTLGDDFALSFVDLLEQPNEYLLALAERISARGQEESRLHAMALAERSVRSGPKPGTVHRLLRLGISPEHLTTTPRLDVRDRLFSLTREALGERIQYEEDAIYAWLDACCIAARVDPLGLASAEALIQGDGWYRCWLRFAVGLCRAEAALRSEQSAGSLRALLELEADLRPFAGKPRSCDLYRLNDVIISTLRRALSLVDDSEWSEAVRIIRAVSDGTAVTMRGEMMGPVPFDVLLDLIIGATTPTRQDVTATLVEEVRRGRSRGRFYPDIAGFYLAGARLALATGDKHRAQHEWAQACVFLVAYGWHKDITIFDLLDPLPLLIEQDIGRARECIATLQPLCERASEHTDGKETYHAPRQWWGLLAAADPVGLAGVIATALLSECNTPVPRLEDARIEIWNHHHAHAHPFIAGALRLTLPSSLGTNDPPALARLADALGDSPTDSGQRLLTLLMSRADERPREYGVSNRADLAARDNALLDEINAIARVAGVSPVHTDAGAPKPSSSTRPPERDLSRRERLESRVLDDFGRGPSSLGRALRAWAQRPAQRHGERWSTARYANALGYRILEAVQAGRVDDAAFAVRMLADAVDSEDTDVLAAVADGLEAHGLVELAATAHVLTWTRSRGGGGWLRFGGITQLDSLKRAVVLDAAVALRVIGDGVRDAIHGGRGLGGVSQALVTAFAGVDIPLSVLGGRRTSSDVAFACWEEAAAVIASRTPAVDSSERPRFPYRPPPRTTPHASGHQLDVALASAAFAGVASAGREQKRRSLVALDLLIRECPDVAGEALSQRLDTISDPLTLSWVLGLDPVFRTPTERRVRCLTYPQILDRSSL